MAETEMAGIGHNNPPAFDAITRDTWASRVADFMRASQQWLNLGRITDRKQAEQVGDQITGLRGLFKNVDAQRKAEKAPHDERAKAVQDAYAPLLKQLTEAAEQLKKMLAVYTAEEQRQLEQEKREAEAAARRQAEEAAKRLAEAAASNDIVAQVEAEEAAKAAEKAQKAAARPAKANVGSASGGGRTMSLRKVKEVRITNANVLFMQIGNEPEVVEALHRAATRIVRSANYDPNRPLKGIDIDIREVVA